MEESPQFDPALIIGEKQKLKALKRIATRLLIIEVSGFFPKSQMVGKEEEKITKGA